MKDKLQKKKKNESKYFLKKYNKFLSNFKKINYINLVFFIMDCIIFALILSGFIFQLIDKGSNQQISMIISYSVLIMSFYILIKFTITNFFYSNIFFIKILLYKKKIVIENTEIEKNITSPNFVHSHYTK